MNDNNSSDSWLIRPIDPNSDFDRASKFLDEDPRLLCDLGLERHQLLSILHAVCSELISHVQECPASMFAHHNGPGGLTSHGMETGILALSWYSGLVKKPGKFSSVKAKQVHLAWAAFTLAQGALHDIGRVGTSIHVTGTSRSGKKRNYDRSNGQSLYSWMLKNSIDGYNIEIQKHLDLSCDPESVADLAVDLLRNHGLLCHRDVAKEISDKTSLRRRQISKLVVEADRHSVEIHRSRHPHLRRSRNDTAMALCEYLHSRQSGDRKMSGGKDPMNDFEYIMAELAGGPPMVDDIFDLFEMYHPPKSN